MFCLLTAILLLSTRLLRPALATTQNATAISSGGCVSPSSFDACIKNATTAETTCKDIAGTDDSVSACRWTKDVSELLCYMSECWNKVYSCEYQYIASNYVYDHGNDTIPFYPAPLNAPGGCSCNMGDLLANATASIDLLQTECKSLGMTSDAVTFEDCQCCGMTAALSAFYGICPNIILSELGNLSNLVTAIQNSTSDSNGGIPTCGGLNSTICLGKFDIGSADGGIYIDPNNLPSSGTESLSTTTRSGYPMTSPPGGQTMTVTIDSTVYTVTAAAYSGTTVDSGAIETGSSIESTSSGSAGVSATSSPGPTGNSGNFSSSVSSLVILYMSLFLLLTLAGL